MYRLIVEHKEVIYDGKVIAKAYTDVKDYQDKESRDMMYRDLTRLYKDVEDNEKPRIKREDLNEFVKE